MVVLHHQNLLSIDHRLKYHDTIYFTILKHIVGFIRMYSKIEVQSIRKHSVYTSAETLVLANYCICILVLQSMYAKTWSV